VRRLDLAYATPVPLTAHACQQQGVEMAGKFELYKDGQGKFRFRLKAGNGEIIAVGEAYESKSSALNGIDSVRRNAADAQLVDQTES
jgi:uncharacterized protein YegP (UPF0339 family)